MENNNQHHHLIKDYSIKKELHYEGLQFHHQATILTQVRACHDQPGQLKLSKS